MSLVDGVQRAQEALRAQLVEIDRALSANKDMILQLQPSRVSDERMTKPRRLWHGQFFLDHDGLQPPHNQDARQSFRQSGVNVVDNIFRRTAFTSQERERLESAVRHENTRLLSFEGRYDISHLSDAELLVNVEGLNWITIARHVGFKTPAECKIQWTVSQHPSINKEPFSKSEIAKLKEIAKGKEYFDWVGIADELGNGRVAWQCCRAYQTVLKPKKEREWTNEEDIRLRELVNQHGHNWTKVSQQLHGRSRRQCLFRWRQSALPGIKKGKWDKLEDKHLLDAVAVQGRGNWIAVAKLVPNRTAIQCRERFENALNPQLRKGAFTTEENMRLRELVAQHGEYSWPTISTAMGTRTAKQCSNAWAKLNKPSHDAG